MRRPSSFVTNRRPLELNMTPMIDCVFLLLVYFLWSSSFVPLEYLLPGEMSAAPAATIGGTSDEPPPPEADFEDVIVRLRGNAAFVTWQLNGENVADLPELQTLLARIASIKQDAPVVVHPDEEVPLGNVIDVYDLARQVGFEKVQFATNAQP